MLEITIENFNKCNLETIIDPNNSQYFCINRRDLELKINVTGKLILISIKTHRHKNIGSITFITKYYQILHFNLMKYL